MIVEVNYVGPLRADFIWHTAFPVREVGKKITLFLPEDLGIVGKYKGLVNLGGVLFGRGQPLGLVLSNVDPAYLILSGLGFQLFLVAAGAFNLMSEFVHCVFESIHVFKKFEGNDARDSTAATNQA